MARMLSGGVGTLAAMPRASDANATPKPKSAAARKPRPRKKTGDSGIRLTGDRLIVRTPDNGERKSAGGLLIPATAMPAPKRLTWGDVTIVGPDVRVAKAGDRVLFLPSAALEVELEGEDLVLLRERDVQAVAEASVGDAKKDRAPGQYL
jgi:chaperonin GroES